MKERTSEINVRVYQTEKVKIKRIAKKAGMNMSDYIRTVAVGKEIKQAPTDGFMKVYQQIKEIHGQFMWSLGNEELCKKFENIEKELLNLYHGKDSETHGSNENMGD